MFTALGLITKYPSWSKTHTKYPFNFITDLWKITLSQMSCHKDTFIHYFYPLFMP